MQRHPDADGRVLLTRDVGEPLDESLVADGGETDGLGPARERARQHAGERVVAERVPGVGGDGDGDAETGRRRQFLHLVVPGRHELARRRRAEHVEVRHALADDHGLVGLESEGGVGRGELAVLAHGDHGLEEQARLLLQAHLAEQVLHALVDGQRRVPVGGVDGACRGSGCRGIRSGIRDAGIDDVGHGVTSLP